MLIRHIVTETYNLHYCKIKDHFCFNWQTENIFLSLISNTDQFTTQDQCFSGNLVRIIAMTNKENGNESKSVLSSYSQRTGILSRNSRHLVRAVVKRRTAYNRYVAWRKESVLQLVTSYCIHHIQIMSKPESKEVYYS